MEHNSINMVEVESCVICGSNSFNLFLSCKDHMVSGEDFQILSCNKCEFKFTSPRPKDSFLGAYYKSESYVSHTNSKKGVVNKLYHVVRNFTILAKINLLSKYVSRGTVLDYGCGTGLFLSSIKNYGWDTYGVEPDFDARRIATEAVANVFSSRDELRSAFINQTFDAITLWHVLEHLTDLTKSLSFFKASLKPDGVLIIALPNYKSYDANYYKKFWAAYDLPRHLYHFDLKTISALLNNFGFKLVKSKPMRFDSYYVSMLSEKCRTGNINFFKAFIIGLISNFVAKGDNSHSSTIYIFKHK
ncbi:MAG: class I SAM-dependent methyltransferase [Bacteroidota bacterium]